jgi:hemerythrin-like domain-containing protein
MSIFQLPVSIQNRILNKYINISAYWKQQFTSYIIPDINAIMQHQIKFEKVLFEFMAYWGKRELEKYSVNGMLFSYNKKSIDKSIESKDLWYVLFEGKKSSNKRITLLFKKHFTFHNEYMIIESSGVFPMICSNYDYGLEEDLGSEKFENIQEFINKFMNSIFTV